MEKRYVITMLLPIIEAPTLKPYALIRVSKRAYRTFELAEKALLSSKSIVPGKAYSIMPVYVKPVKK